MIKEKFSKLGARIKIEPARNNFSSDLAIDIRKDAEGEFFDIRVKPDVELSVVDIDAPRRHLLLMSKIVDNRGRATKNKFLCGHDERHWFVAAVPGAPAT